MSLSDVRIARVLLQVALAALSLAVIGLTSKALNGLDNDRHKLQQQLPGGDLEAKPMVGVGIVLAIVCGGIILHACLNSIYILKDRVPQAIRKRCPQGFSSKSMIFSLIQLTPLNIAQTAFTARQKAQASANGLPDSVVEQLIRLSGRSLYYRDNVTVVDYTVIAWIVWLLLIIGICIERSKYSSVQYSNTEKQTLES
ncbi:hypothetical protein PCANC_10212 [Puccinia coronata f. sp. avenae]|uniref:Uncharacterized protein n=1 Tax=Puccinia coronata f. sp. avenae TaxID=200324 RepID=A0A2N5SI54_9BASI|nr:hypothetical protein PCANC_27459 [Puccinia coronata f. sp. avenae]PLW12913.1 hypothetical protein PCASD_22090 [Puccinia coronata f. sp. avenae]PLW48439.1 hypothetical protein PCANC_10212 [Puccinia coronata f. sp. avenae]PLW48629.1 hypothetical protein PCASD_03360 [Puccinia coronata f. sp. avenae]